MQMYFIYEETKHGWKGWICTKGEALSYTKVNDGGYACVVVSNEIIPLSFDVEFDFVCKHKSCELNKARVRWINSRGVLVILE